MPRCIDCQLRKKNKRCREKSNPYREIECDKYSPDLQKISKTRENRLKRKQE